MEYEIERAFSTNETFVPIVWPAYQVLPIQNDEGDTLAYCGVGSPREVKELPCEIFNHEMKHLNLDDHFQVVDFMTAYGMVGCHGKERSDFARYLTRGRIDFDSVESIWQFEVDFGYESIFPNDNCFISHKRLSRYFKELAKGVQKISEETGGRIDCVVSGREVKETMWALMRSAKTTKAIMQTSNPIKIAELADIPLDGLYDEVGDNDSYINYLLEGISPRIGIIEKHQDIHSSPSYTESVFGGKCGSFEQAVALQIWEFALKGGSYRVCKECHEVFQKKRSSSRKSTPRADSEFCCEKCRNRFTQREYRKSPGYKLKQQKKKTNST